MNTITPTEDQTYPVALIVCASLALAIAMGVGRFALTPLLPFMLSEGIIGAGTGNVFAISNYVGYLLGALSVASIYFRSEHKLLTGLIGVSLSTLAMAIITPQLQFSGAAIRCLAGVFSAWTLVSTSTWAMQALARTQQQHWSGYVYCGVGAGIALAGLLVWGFQSYSSSHIWLLLGLICSVCTLLCWRLQRWSQSLSASAVTPAELAGSPSDNYKDQSIHQATPVPMLMARQHGTTKSVNQTGLMICYGIFGYAYVLPATYLPVIARDYIPDPSVFGLIWPVFGSAAFISVAITTRYLAGISRNRVWAVAQFLLAVGVILPAVEHGPAGLATAALLSGATFMVITMAGLQLARQICPEHAQKLQGRMTAAFALGQIGGPVSVAIAEVFGAIRHGAPTVLLALAAALLVISAGWLLRQPADCSTIYNARHPCQHK